MVSTVARRHLMETSRTEEPNEHGFVEDSWFRDEKQDGDVHKSSGPSAKGGLSIKERSAKHASLATQKANPVPNPTARQARYLEAYQQIGQTSSSVQKAKKTMFDSCLAMATGVADLAGKGPPRRVMMALQHRAGIETCQPIAAQLA